ncbi:MAG: ATP-binding protein [Promethearchaeota archaeon]
MSAKEERNIDLKYKKVVNVLNKAGEFPIPFSDVLLKILKHTIKVEELDFILAFRRNISQTMEQLKESSKLSEEEILKNVSNLAKMGVIFDQPNRRGVMIYRLLPIIRQSEYIFMQKLEKTEENKELAILFNKLHEELKKSFNMNQDALTEFLKTLPPIDRTVPTLENKDGDSIEISIDKELDIPLEEILPTQRIEDLIKKYDEIAAGHCYCRHQKHFLGEPCKQIELEVENCFTLGKSARHTSKHGFSRMVSQEEALEILKKSEKAGLVHKAYHLYSDTSKEEVAICNCCKCCCINSRSHAFIPLNNSTNWVAQIDQNVCTGCGTCVEKCHNDAIELNDDDRAERIEEYCIGCGVCALHCPENAISLIQNKRIVNIIPKD